MAKAAKTAVTGNEPAFVTERKKYCLAPCEFLTKTHQCDVCGCFVKAKTQETDEYCPKNFWEDIKEFVGHKVAIRNPMPDVYKLVYSGIGVHMELHLIEGVGSLETINLKFNVINDTGKQITKIKIRPTCGCTIATEPPSRLADGDSFEVGLDYTATRFGNAGQLINKTTRLIIGDSTFYVKIVGKSK